MPGEIFNGLTRTSPQGKSLPQVNVLVCSNSTNDVASALYSCLRCDLIPGYTHMREAAMNSKLFSGLLICAVVFMPFWAAAQVGTNVTGKVTDAEGNPMVGANVVLVGYDLGSATDAKGNYTFLVPANQVKEQTASLMASFIGYHSKSAKI